MGIRLAKTGGPQGSGETDNFFQNGYITMENLPRIARGELLLPIFLSTADPPTGSLVRRGRAADPRGIKRSRLEEAEEEE
jgi:hypothetical protein